MRRNIWSAVAQQCQELIGAALVVVLLAGCGGTDNTVEDTAPDVAALSNTERLVRYQTSLLAETNWLWANMLYAQDHARPDDARCPSPDFDHQPAELDETGRSQDSAVATLEQLDYAEMLIAQARDEWQAHCEGERPSANAAAYLKSRLEPAYTALERARGGIEARQRSEARP